MEFCVVGGYFFSGFQMWTEICGAMLSTRENVGVFVIAGDSLECRVRWEKLFDVNLEQNHVTQAGAVCLF